MGTDVVVVVGGGVIAVLRCAFFFPRFFDGVSARESGVFFCLD